METIETDPEVDAELDAQQERQQHNERHHALATGMRDALIVVGELRTQIARLAKRVGALERALAGKPSRPEFN